MGDATDAVAGALEEAAADLCENVDRLSFGPPVTHVYNPLSYAWEAHRRYIRSFAPGGARIVFIGMNPGPWGMAQTGVPFGEVGAVRDWLGISAKVLAPRKAHPKRPVLGLHTERSEVSGRRLWGLFRQRYGTPQQFFSEHFVANYCPLLFLEDSGRNRTPDKLAAAERAPLFEACDAHLRRLVAALRPHWVIGVGAFAETRVRAALADTEGAERTSDAEHHRAPSVGRILHPSPASPRANQGWAQAATEELVEMGVWD
ncbi:MAG: single-stranded DNA-binding protein [Spirochaetia bacterium]